MKKVLLVICLFAVSFSFAQKKKKFNFKEINSGMVSYQVDTISFLRYDDDQLGLINQKYGVSDVIGRASMLDGAASQVIKSNGWKGDLDGLTASILQTKKIYPELDVSGYNKLLNYYILKNANEKRRTDSLKIVANKKYDEEKRVQDSINNYNMAVYKAKAKAEKLISDSLDLIAEKDRQRRMKIADVEYRQLCIKKFGSKIGNQVADGEVHFGYNRDMVNLALGTSNNKSFTTTKSVKIETWYYDNVEVVFKNGVVAAITNY